MTAAPLPSAAFPRLPGRPFGPSLVWRVDQVSSTPDAFELCYRGTPIGRGDLLTCLEAAGVEVISIHPIQPRKDLS